MNREEIKQKIVDYVNESDFVAYRDIELIFNRIGFDWAGELELFQAGSEEFTSWYGWNKEACKLINELQDEGLIRSEETDDFICFAHGKSLTFPKADTKKKYDRNNWRRIVFRKALNVSDR